MLRSLTRLCHEPLPNDTFPFSFSPLTRADIWSNSFENPIYKGIVTSETSCLQRGTNTRDLSRSLNSASVVGLPLDYRYYIPLPLVNSQLPIKRVTKRRGSISLCSISNSLDHYIFESSEGKKKLE